MMKKSISLVAFIAFGLASHPAAATVDSGIVDVLSGTESISGANFTYDYSDNTGSADNHAIVGKETSAIPQAGSADLAAANSNDAYAILPDSSHGVVEFSGTSTATITQAGITADPAAFVSAYGYDVFSYAFSITTPGILNVTYLAQDNGLVTSVPMITLVTSPDYINPIVGPPPSSTFDNRNIPINGQGSVLFDFSPGYHELQIFSDTLSQNAVQTGAAGQTRASSDEHFSFGITPGVPEPATWLMMLAGFGVVGQGLRRAPCRNLTSTPASSTPGQV